MGKYLKIEKIEHRSSYKAMIKRSRHLLLPYAVLKTMLVGKRLEDELTRFDYTLLWFMSLSKSILVGLKNLEPIGLHNIKFNAWYNARRIDSFFNAPEKERKQELEISKRIEEANGVIPFLQLDKENTIIEMNKKYKNSKKNGVDLFIELLRQKYANAKK